MTSDRAAPSPADDIAAARRRKRWRAAQKARRERQHARGMTQLRIWVTETEAVAAREAVKKIRRAALLRRLEQRAQQHAMGSEGSHLKCSPLRPSVALCGTDEASSATHPNLDGDR